jgi:hypothetical protein
MGTVIFSMSYATWLKPKCMRVMFADLAVRPRRRRGHRHRPDRRHQQGATKLCPTIAAFDEIATNLS